MGGPFFQTIRRRSTHTLACVASCLFIAWSGAAFAQSTREAPVSAGDPTVIKLRFANAQKLFKEGRFGDALPLFQNLADTTQSPNARLYVGHCLKELGKFVEAHAAFTAVVKEINDHPDEKYQPTREAAISELAVLNVRLGRVIINVAESPPNVVVKLDGNAVEEKTLGSSIVVAPGAHHVEATAGALAPVRGDVNIEGGEVKTVLLSFKKAVDETPFSVVGSSNASVATTPSADSKSDDGATMRTMGFVAGGVGVAGLAVFTITGLMAKSAFNDLETKCGGPCADASYVDQIHRGKTLQTTANVGLVVGLVGVAAGATLFVVGRPHHPDASVAVSLSGGGGTLSYTARF
jgi:hypothetical protein